MHAHMNGEHDPAHKCLTANATFMSTPFGTVTTASSPTGTTAVHRTHVTTEGLRFRECLTAQLTAMGPAQYTVATLNAMRPQMTHEAALPTEAAITPLAGKRPLASVCAHVAAKIRHFKKSLVARPALVWPVACVSPQMVGQVAQLAKCSWTELAGVFLHTI